MFCDKNTKKCIFQIIIIFLQIINLSKGFCPAKCLCTGDQNLNTSCIGANLDVVPIQLNPDVKFINLTANSIESIIFSFSFYKKLEILDLSKNKIENLNSKNFDAQTELKLLNLSSNRITKLHKETFRGLKNLENLDLSSNKIEMIHQSAMHDLGHLIKLDMTDNLVTSLTDERIFSHLSNLEILIFKNNQLLDVPTENLDYLRLLKSLDLSGNLIETIKNNSFDKLKELTFLNLQGNVISDLEFDAFEGLSSLKVLDLSDNNLTVVPTLQLSKLSNLTYLSLSGNYFTVLPAVALLNLFHLRELQLERLDRLIKIDSRTFVDNTNLQIVSLDNNPELSELPSRLFHGNPNLVEISIRGNNLQRLDAAQFPLDHLQRLRLANNPLECNCSILWLWRLTSGHYQTPNDANSDDADDDEKKNSPNVLILDKNDIGCDLFEDNMKTRRILKNMEESDIKCPGNLVTLISLIFSITVVVMALTSLFIYMRFQKRRKKILHERKNVNERIVPQQVDKLELERYLAAQAIANEYRALRPWEIPVVKEAAEPEPDHYEKFEYFDRRTLNGKPHVVYV